MQNRRRYSRERASQSLRKISQKLENSKFYKNTKHRLLHPSCFFCAVRHHDRGGLLSPRFDWLAGLSARARRELQLQLRRADVAWLSGRSRLSEAACAKRKGHAGRVQLRASVFGNRTLSAPLGTRRPCVSTLAEFGQFRQNSAFEKKGFTFRQNYF